MGCLIGNYQKGSSHLRVSSSSIFMIIILSYLEECIFATLEPRVLSIVHKDGGVINDRHLSEALLGVQKHIEDRDDADSHEATNDEVVLCHRVVLLL